ncbi:hypothetical protein [Spirosoma areae]
MKHLTTEAIRQYFNAEKAESLIFFGMGVAALGLGLYFLLVLKRPFTNGMAWPLMAVALIQLTVGTTVYLRSPKDIARVENYVINDRSKISADEIPRMETVMQSFQTYKYIELGLMGVGLLLVLFQLGPFWSGVGAGLLIQAGLMLLADYFAMSRGTAYLAYLHHLVQ